MTMTAITKRMHIGDPADWHFVNGPWQDHPDGRLGPTEQSRALDGDSLQNFHFAFAPRRTYQDVRVRFDFRLAAHSDAGIVLRARDESQFYLLHFPNCGQACRAQHFWAALSRMDQSGYLRIVKLKMVRRVPSTCGLWLGADVALRGNRLSARIGEDGCFEVQDDAYRDSGAVGLFLFANAELRNVVLEGVSAPATWNERFRQPKNWFCPCPDTRYGAWQRSVDLVRFLDGELLLGYDVQERPYEGKITPLLSRSTDGGRTWSSPEPLQIARGDMEWQPARIHLTPAGRLISLIRAKEGFLLAESQDRGATWTEPMPVNLPVKTEHVAALHLGPAGPLNLADGSMLLFLYGSHDLKQPDLNIWTWGSLHCQAFACRSTDDGRSWSEPVNVDNPGCDKDGNPFEGNLDLTEVCGAQMGNGRILGLVRPIYSPWMWETWSSDGGRTWGPCVRGPFAGYAAPNMLRTRSGHLLVAHRLPGLTIHTSPDEGRTWDQGTLIDSGLWAMGSMIELEPDVVLYVYWDTAMSLMRAQFVRLTPAGLQPVRLTDR